MERVQMIDYCSHCGYEKELTVKLYTMYGVIYICEECYKEMCDLYCKA
jgi:hypothetical protein